MIPQTRHAFAWMVGVSLTIGASCSFAATINYGDFGPDYPPGVTIYQDVRESSGTDPIPPQRFGPPTLSGDNLDFAPTSFVASANGAESDTTDVQLNLGMQVVEGINNEVGGGLTSLLITESGDYSLLGAGTASTSVVAGISADIDILEVDGVPITPISMFASSSISRDLVTDGPVALAPWNNGLLIEFGPVLAANNVPFQYGVTKAEVVLDDQLVAIGEAGSVSFIAKKDFLLQPGVTPNPNFVIPEPASAVLALALLGCITQRRGRPAEVRG